MKEKKSQMERNSEPQNIIRSASFKAFLNIGIFQIEEEANR